MTENQQIIEITVDELVKKVTDFQKNGYRLVQMNCTKFDTFEINYSFDKNYEFVNFRIHLPLDAELPSVSSIYWCASLYENEMHDLYGVNVKNMIVDFKGHLYTTAVKTPFNNSNQ